MDNNQEESIWSDLATLGKKVLPYVAIATVGASALGVAAMFNEKRQEKPRIDNELEKFGHLNVSMGEAACLQLVIRFACISPDWHQKYLEKADQLAQIYGNFHILVDQCEGCMNDSEVAADASVEQVNLSNETLELWRKRAYQSKYLAAQWLQDAITIRMNIVALSIQLTELIRAWNIYWNAVGSIFLTPVSLSANATASSNKRELQILEVKMRLVETLRMDGLDSVLKIGTNYQRDPQDARQLGALYDVGSANVIVTSHVGWWVRMHGTFLPQMSLVAQKLGWYGEGHDFDQEAMAAAASIASPSSSSKKSNKGTRIEEAKPLASSKSSVVDQLEVWKSRLQKDGVVNVIADPWKGFQPSPWEETFIPTCNIESKSVQGALSELQKKYDSNIQFMIECIRYIEASFSRVMIATGKIGIKHPTLMSPDELDERFSKHAAIANQASGRIKILEIVWNRMAI